MASVRSTLDEGRRWASPAAGGVRRPIWPAALAVSGFLGFCELAASRAPFEKAVRYDLLSGAAFLVCYLVIGLVLDRAGGHGDTDFVPLSAELATQDAYLDIERVRFGERLQVERRISAELAAAKVPHLILQPLVENAVKYGVSRTPEPVRVEIAAARAGAELVLTVEDSGAPDATSQPAGLGLGLKNVEGRLKSLYGDAGRLACRSLSPAGFLAEVRIPFEL